jgi:hypothetical protein
LVLNQPPLGHLVRQGVLFTSKDGKTNWLPFCQQQCCAKPVRAIVRTGVVVLPVQFASKNPFLRALAALGLKSLLTHGVSRQRMVRL